MREVQEAAAGQVELFLNSVPILSPLTREDKLRLVDALETKVGGWVAGWCVVLVGAGGGGRWSELELGWSWRGRGCDKARHLGARRGGLPRACARRLPLSPDLACPPPPVQTYPAGTKVVAEGQPGQHFYIVQEGEAVVYQASSSGSKKVNHLFKVGPPAGAAAGDACCGGCCCCCSLAGRKAGAAGPLALPACPPSPRPPPFPAPATPRRRPTSSASARCYATSRAAPRWRR